MVLHSWRRRNTLSERVNLINFRLLDNNEYLRVTLLNSKKKGFRSIFKRKKNAFEDLKASYVKKLDRFAAT